MATKQAERRQAWKKAGLCYYCGSEKDAEYVSCESCREKRRKHNRPASEESRAYYANYRAKIRIEVIQHYGGVCACCGEDEPTFLELDHIENDGAAHRIELMGSRTQAGIAFYRKLRSLGYPKGIVQVLCANCHRAKTSFGACVKHSVASLAEVG